MNSKQRKFETPVDDKEEMPMSQEQFREAFDSLVEDGLLVATGELIRRMSSEQYQAALNDNDLAPQEVLE